jgi:uncharacterized membrane protein YfcA
MEQMVLLAAIGCITGFLSGLLGIGGGVIIVPSLILVLPQLGVAGPDLVKIAMATSLATSVLTSLSSVRQHIASRAVHWPAVLRLAPGIAAGSFAGTQISAAVNGELLTFLFIAFLLYGSWSMLQPRQSAAITAAPLPGIAGLSIKGFAIGVFCSLLGISGTLFTVPLLAAYLSVQHSIGTATALGLPLAVTAALGYMLLPGPAGTCPMGCSGFVYLPGAGAIATATILTAPLGAYLTHALPARPLRWMFAAVMMVIAIPMIWKTLPDGQSAIAANAQAARPPVWLFQTDRPRISQAAAAGDGK